MIINIIQLRTTMIILPHSILPSVTLREANSSLTTTTTAGLAVKLTNASVVRIATSLYGGIVWLLLVQLVGLAVACWFGG